MRKGYTRKKRVAAASLAFAMFVGAFVSNVPINNTRAATIGEVTVPDSILALCDEAAKSVDKPQPGVRTNFWLHQYHIPAGSGDQVFSYWQLAPGGSISSELSKYSWRDTLCINHSRDMKNGMKGKGPTCKQAYHIWYYFGNYELDGGGDGSKYPGELLTTAGGDLERTKLNFLMQAYACAYCDNLGYARRSTSDLCIPPLVSNLIVSIAEEAVWTGDWAKDQKSFLAEKANYIKNLSAANSVLTADFEAQADAQFRSIWNSAILSYCCQVVNDGGGLVGKATSSMDAQGMTHITFTFPEILAPLIQQAAITTVGDWTYSITANSVDFVSPTGNNEAGVGTIDFSAVPDVMKQWIGKEEVASFRIPCLTTENKISFFMQQERLATAFTNSPKIAIGPITGSSGIPGSSGNSGGAGYSVTRYDHNELWDANYKVALLKRDSETGEPLEGVTFDILEAFDDSQIDATSLDDDNWGNDLGSQFDRWTEWDGPYEDGEDGDPDPCSADQQITGEDGFLYEMDSTTGGLFKTDTQAHRDVKKYTYHKGYCGGHPKPPEGDDEESEEAQAQYEAELEKCAEMVAEGGYFCGGAADEDGSIAKSMMEEDRDKHYQEFVSLTYDYSARELETREGYILHNYDPMDVHGVYENIFDGIHTDTIPIETINVHSSEWYDIGQNGIKHGGAGAASILANGFTSSAGLTSSASGSGKTYAKTSSATAASASNSNKSVRIYEETGEIEMEPENTESVKATESEAVQDEDYIPDVEFGKEEETKETETVTEKKVSKATESNAKKAASKATESEAEKNDETKTYGGTSIITKAADLLHSFFDKLFGVKEDKGTVVSSSDPFYESSVQTIALLAAAAKQHPVRDSITWTPSPAPVVTPADIDYKYGGEAKLHDENGEEKYDGYDWLFVLYDHRTEGEIHFNKRDLDLDNDINDKFDDYSVENADSSLEGAVYGLFAKEDIIHPDGKTGVVFSQGDLVAIATTDRNGDGSFITITEAPGTDYDYETGRLVRADQDVTNYYTDDYHKHSSNEYTYDPMGERWYYPITNNESNNMNEWIGRPIFLGAYYIKELSRSEGYELSVFGKDMTTTNRESFLNGGDVTPEGEVSIISDETPARNEFSNFTEVHELEIKSSGTTNGYDIEFSNVNWDMKPHFFITKKEKSTEEYEAKRPIEKEVEVKAVPNTRVSIDGDWVEAKVGDTITTPSGNQYTVTNTVTMQKSAEYKPYNNLDKDLVVIPTFDEKHYAQNSGTDYDTRDSYIDAWNRLLESNADLKDPGDGAPYIMVELGSVASYSAWNSALNEFFSDSNMDVPAFDAARVDSIMQRGGVYYAKVSYAFLGGREEPYDVVYSASDECFYVRYDVEYTDGSEGWIYRKVPLSEIQADGKSEAFTGESGSYTGLYIQNLVCQQPIEVNSDLDDVTWVSGVEYGEYWAYAEGDNLLDNEGNVVTQTITEFETYTELLDTYTYEDVEFFEDDLEYDEATGTYIYHVDPEDIPEDGIIHVTVYYDSQAYEGEIGPAMKFSVHPSMAAAGSYIVEKSLNYKDEFQVMEDSGTVEKPAQVEERAVRQKVRINKDIQTLPETKYVWYCLNCGYENSDDDMECGHCGHEKSTEETKPIDYAHDTYSAVHADNISAERDGGWYETVKDWLAKLMGREVADEQPVDIPNFRFKAYLKSNLERLYRDNDGKVVWMDRNGNVMKPQYEDTNGDGNYDTFTWKYDTAYDGKEVDFPEKDVLTDGVLESSNVQKIYTKVEHNTDSVTTSAQANNVWDDYNNPQDGATENAGEREGYTTSLRDDGSGSPGGLDGKAVDTNAALYSYDGQNTNVAESDRINEDQDTGYTRLLETRPALIEDGHDTRTVETYNYEKFFDAIHAANLDIWDNDMFSTYDGYGMDNYPGQHWFDTFLEEYQKDDTDPDHKIENTDNADKDNTTGGDRDTSFKPFRWIREKVFGDREDYEKYPAEHNGINTEVVTSTSDFARSNAKASDAMRQFATKWYLQDEVAKLVTNNGVDEDIAKPDGEITYDEDIYDEALYNALAKSYNYLRPFYQNDLDTIYSVEWDSAKDGGADTDYTTLSIDREGDNEYYDISAYLPYGVYVVVEQQPERVDKTVNDFENRSYGIEKPKEVIVPAVYDAEQPNDTTDNYDPHYNYDYDMDLQDQAKTENYLIRFGEEWAHNNSQDEREYVIRAHNFHGDYEVYKYGLDTDLLTGEISYDDGNYEYAGWNFTQEEFDPLKDYYDTVHRGEAGVERIEQENGGNDESSYHFIDETPGDQSGPMRYDTKKLIDRFFYANVSEDAGVADNVMYKGGDTDDNNVSGMQWKDKVRAMTGQLTAYQDKYSAALVPWSVTEPADVNQYSSDDFSGLADVNERDTFYTAMLRINKTDSETGEYILHDNAIFGLYAGSRYNTFEEIEADANLIADGAEREKFLAQFKPGDAKFYLQDTMIEGSREFLMAMGATEITPMKRRGVVESIDGAGVLCTGIVKKGTPVCVESERIDLTDNLGAKTGQMTVFTTVDDVYVAGEEDPADKVYADQNTGYFITPQPIGAGVYVLAEIKAPDGYARSKPVPFEVYSDKTQYYVDGDMYQKVSAVRYDGNLLEDIIYEDKH